MFAGLLVCADPVRPSAREAVRAAVAAEAPAVAGVRSRAGHQDPDDDRDQVQAVCDAVQERELGAAQLDIALAETMRPDEIADIKRNAREYLELWQRDYRP